jgi:secreted PhoX family phosphatase
VTAAYRRREFIGMGVGGAVALGFGSSFWSGCFDGSDPSRPRGGKGYGPLRPPDENGVRLPDGFTSRVIARGEEEVAGTGYRWHRAADGSATFPTKDGGFVLVSNSEEPIGGGAGAIRFRPDGEIADAYPILEGTTSNCSGGGTPWGTWLSCEEVEGGQVWECDPSGRRKARPRPAMGLFKHEACAVDPTARRIYLTEDLIDGGLYRFTPRRWHDLSEGLLEIAIVRDGGVVDWRRVPDPAARRERTRRQVPGSTEFKRGEGIWFDSGTLYVATTGDSRLHAYDTRRERIEVIYDGLSSRDTPLLRIDQLTASPAGELFICEDFATEEIHMGVIAPDRNITHFLVVTGKDHHGSEITGAAFDPSGAKLFFSSQRAREVGAIYEVTGPFQRRRA